MAIKVRKKPTLIGVLAAVLILITLGVFWYLDPANEEYEDLGMKPTSTVAENILDSAVSTAFAEGISTVGYDTFLNEEGPFTVFVPTDEAYGNLPDETAAALVNPAEEGYFRSVLQYHVVEGRYLEKDLKDGMTLTTIQGEELTVTRKDGNIILNGYAYIQTYDVLSKNGVIHVTTNYVLPPSMVGN